MHESVRENRPADEIGNVAQDSGKEWHYEWNPPDRCRDRVGSSAPVTADIVVLLMSASSWLMGWLHFARRATR
jgi:hypothetical protein